MMSFPQIWIDGESSAASASSAMADQAGRLKQLVARRG
jgi:hypothetical protein